MATKIRLARGGSKKRPYYRIVIADARVPRDSSYIEKVGSYNPLLAKDDAERIKYDAERIKYWLSTGAEPTETIARFLRKDGLLTTKPIYTAKKKIEKLAPRAEARKEAEESAKAEAEANAKAEAEAPKEEAVVEEVATEEVAETPAEETPKEEAPKEEAKSDDDAKTEEKSEAPAEETK